MATCNKCGAPVPEGTAYCANCARPAENSVKGLCVLVFIGALVNLAGVMIGSTMTFIAGLALLFAPMLIQKESAAVRYYSNQGLALFVGNVAVLILFTLIDNLIGLIPGVFGLSTIKSIILTVFDVLHFGLTVTITVFAALGLAHAVKGSTKPIPLFSKIKFFK